MGAKKDTIKRMKKVILLGLALLFIPVIVFAAGVSSDFKSFDYKKSDSIIYALRKDGKTTYKFTQKGGAGVVFGFMTYESGTQYYYKIDIPDNTKPSKGTIAKYKGANEAGTSIYNKQSITISNPPKSIKPGVSPGAFETMFGGTCSDYNCWIRLVWNWATAILIPLSILVLTAAGVVYMTSGGNPDRVGLAKKMIVGAVSGVGLIVLSRVILTVLGVGGSWNV